MKALKLSLILLNIALTMSYADEELALPDPDLLPEAPSTVEAPESGLLPIPAEPEEEPAPDSPDEDAPIAKPPVAVWECHLPTGSFVIRTSDLMSVSQQEYRSGDGKRITETTVASSGAVFARFFHEEPLVASAFAEDDPLLSGLQALDRVRILAETPDQAVIARNEAQRGHDVLKNPNNPQPHVIEHCLSRKADILRIFRSAQTALKTQQSASLTIAE